MGKLNGLQIKSWIKNGISFEGNSDGNGLYLRYRSGFSIPIWRFRYRFAGKKLQHPVRCQKNSQRYRTGFHWVMMWQEKQELKAEAKIEAKKNAFTAGQLADKHFNGKKPIIALLS